MKNIVIIGGGIIGCFLAQNFSQYDCNVHLIEKHQDVCEEVSGANSAIIHAGYDPDEGTLKALLNKRGADMYPAICKRLHVNYLACGAMVVACGSDEEITLANLFQRAQTRNVDVEYVDIQSLHKLIPNISDQVTKGMYVKDTAIITPWEVCFALMDEFLLNGGKLHTKEEVCDIKRINEQWQVITTKNKYYADLVINCAGLSAQKIMEMVEEQSLFKIDFKRGQYYVLSKLAKDYVNQIVYPVPSKVGKGVLVVPTIDGNILIGPNNELILDEDTSTTSAGLAEVKNKIMKTMKNVPYNEVIHTYSGIRPSGNHGDFFIDHGKDETMIHLGCIDSPGIASAPAISEYVMQNLVRPIMNLKRKSNYVLRQADVNMQRCSFDEKQAYIHQKPAYGKMICRCEKVSEQEIVDSIHRPCGARSVKGVKRRVRAGMGKCQGGFCEVEVAKILARELQIPLYEVVYDEDVYYMESKDGD